MGYYVNPPGESKEQFLKTHGAVIGENVKWEDIPDGHLPVILIDNGFMTAAAIGYHQGEYECFLDPNDSRPRTVYQVKIADLLPVSGDDFESYAEGNGLKAVA